MPPSGRRAFSQTAHPKVAASAAGQARWSAMCDPTTDVRRGGFRQVMCDNLPEGALILRFWICGLRLFCGMRLVVGFGLESSDHCLDRGGADDSGAGDGQDLTCWLVGVVEASYGHSVVQDAEGEGGDEGEAESGGDEALGGPVLVGLDHPAGFEPGLVEGS